MANIINEQEVFHHFEDPQVIQTISLTIRLPSGKVPVVNFPKIFERLILDSVVKKWDIIIERFRLDANCELLALLASMTSPPRNSPANHLF